MAAAAISFTVQKLGNLAIESVVFLHGVEEEVGLLKSELKRMQCFLKDASVKQGNDERVRHWISEVREVAQDAEDAIEAYVVKVETPRRSRGRLGVWACFPTHVYRTGQIGEEIQRIRGRLEAIDRSRVRYGIQNLGEGGGVALSEDGWRRQVSPWQNDKHVVGFKEDVELLLSRAVLEGKKKGISMANIAGTAGIGKSTLARLVYNHGKVVDRFQCRAWVVVSGEFSPREVIKELVQQILKPSEDELKLLQTMAESEMQRLQQMLHQRLQGKRYFVVLDDVWDSSVWESLAGAFPVEDKGSVLLLTSRKQDILSRAAYVHKMKPLNAKESWELFMEKSAIGENTKQKFPKKLEKIGREILKKCDGLPLAITVVGGLLAKQTQSESEWELFLKGLHSHLGIQNSALKILELSYIDLPPELKACFLCLSFFKEDATINAKRLIHIWIAQGLISGEGRKETMEEIARSYLDELINRNMIRVKDTAAGNRAKGLHIHDLFREVAVKNAKEEISFEILRDGAGSSSDRPPRHRAIYCSGETFSYSAKRNNRIRSLFFHGAAKFEGNPSFWKSFKLLRVLDFDGCGLKKLPDAIGAVIGLRYLGLRNNNLKELPGSLGRLKKLQVLDISKNIFIQVPNVICKMYSLRHVYMSRINCNVLLRIDRLEHLQTAAYIPVANWSTKNLKKMVSLHTVGIELEADSDLMQLCDSLSALEKLVRLNLRWQGFKSMASLDKLCILQRLTELKLRGALNELPRASYFPPNLSCLSLVGTWLGEDPMPVLERLPNLCHLKLDCAYNGDKMVVSYDGFPRLQVMSMYGLFSLRKIKVGKGGMPGLKVLEINACPKLKSLPAELSLISNLQSSR